MTSFFYKVELRVICSLCNHTKNLRGCDWRIHQSDYPEVAWIRSSVKWKANDVLQCLQSIRNIATNRSKTEITYAMLHKCLLYYLRYYSSFFLISIGCPYKTTVVQYVCTVYGEFLEMCWGTKWINIFNCGLPYTDCCIQDTGLFSTQQFPFNSLICE